MGKITKKELKTLYKDHLTIGDLKQFIKDHDLQDDAKVLIERVEDVYYEEHNWDVYKKKSEIGESQYHPAWSCIKYGDEKEHLFIDLHY